MSKFDKLTGSQNDPAKEAELMNRGLPKWPQMLVKGDTIKDTDALEIIRRTDSFFQGYGGNDRAFTKQWIGLMGIPSYDDSRFMIDGKNDWQAFEAYREDWNKKWGYIGDKLEYISNDWIASAFIGGPHGWCHPSGKIEYTDNVGKWPSIETILAEWKILADHFPFLRLGAVLMNGESCEDNSEAIVAIHVENGNATLHDPKSYDLVDLFGGKPEPHSTIEQNLMRVFTMGHEREHGIPTSVLSDWALKYRSLFPQ